MPENRYSNSRGGRECSAFSKGTTFPGTVPKPAVLIFTSVEGRIIKFGVILRLWNDGLMTKTSEFLPIKLLPRLKKSEARALLNRGTIGISGAMPELAAGRDPFATNVACLSHARPPLCAA
jgi:hypothetical protein